MNNTAKLIISALFILLGSFFLHKWICGGSSAAPAKMSIMDGNWKTGSFDAFSFANSGATLNASTTAQAEIKKAAKYLKDNPDRTLNLEGNYYKNEKKGSIKFDNLGIARAEAVKALLVKGGASTDNISTTGKLMEGMQLTADKLYNAVSFVFGNAEAAPSDDVSDATPATRSVLDPFVIRFASGNDKISMTSELRSYLDEALAYLASNNGTQLVVTGHTDDQGSASSNKKLSESRAKKVRRFLRQNGVESAQVIAEGKGEENPLKDNSTEEGRKLNRRVEITIR